MDRAHWCLGVRATALLWGAECHVGGASTWEPGVQSVTWQLGEAGGSLISQSFGLLSVKWDETYLTGLLGGLNSSQ